MAIDAEKTLELEEETLLKVSDSISKIEVALSEWNAAGKKPKKLEKRIAYLIYSHKLLSGWAKESLKGKRDPRSSLLRLQKFADMCDELERKGAE